VTWNLEDISPTWAEKEGKKNEIQLEVTLYPYATSVRRNLEETWDPTAELWVEAQISFPLGPPKTLIKERASKIKTFIQFPITGKTGRRKEKKLSPSEASTQTKVSQEKNNGSTFRLNQRSS
jgi:hypothetical protein